MIKILLGNLDHYKKVNGNKIACHIDNTNQLVDQIKHSLKGSHQIIFIPAGGNNPEKAKEYGNLLFQALKLDGIKFDKYTILTKYNKRFLPSYVLNADLIFLSGGDTYEQMTYFNNIGLKDLLQNFQGLVIGQSAGALNMARSVYNSPENMEESEPTHFEGLGLVDINIEPHFELDIDKADASLVYQRNDQLKESHQRTIYALNDHISHIFVGDDGKATIYGHSYIIKDGKITPLTQNAQSKIISSSLNKKRS